MIENEQSVISSRRNTASKRDRMFVLVALLFSVFCILKVMRGADVDSTQQGGIWNYISLLYYPLFLYGIVCKRRMRLKVLFMAPLIYSFLAWMISLERLFLKFSISTAYSFLMLPYFFLVLSVFYFFARESRRAENIMTLTYLICLAINSATIFQYQFSGAERALAADVYFPLALYPFMLQFVKNSKIKILLSAVQFFTAFLSNKRTALILFVVGIIVYLLVQERNKKNCNIWKLIVRILLIGVVVLALYNISRFIDEIYELDIYNRLMRITEDGGSGRGSIYLRILEAYQDSSLFEKLFGHGMNTAGAVGGAGHAHNDLLEVLYNYGAIACALIVIFYVSIIVEMVRMIARKSTYAAAYSFSVITGVFLGMFSYFLIYYTYVTCTVAFWGYALAMERKRLKALRTR